MSATLKLMLYTDIKYVNLISSQLQLFKKTGTYVWNFRCPYCGDSKKKKTKARGYIFRNSKNLDELAYKCHNCGIYCYFWKFLKDNNSELYKEYLIEKMRDQNEKTPEQIVTESTHATKHAIQHFTRAKLTIPSISELERDHWVLPWISKRKIPVEHWGRLYFARDFRDFVVTNFGEEYAKKLVESEPRLVIPFLDKSKNIIAVQGRALLTNGGAKYVTVKFSDQPCIFGLDTVNEKSTVYVVEGPIDSLFLKNCVAAAGLDLAKIGEMFDDTVFIFDNEKHNKDVLRSMNKVIEMGKKIFIWPNSIPEKDINDCIIAGYDIQKIIQENIYSGIEAKVRFTFWKKS